MTEIQSKWFEKYGNIFKSIQNAETIEEAWEKSFAKWELILAGKIPLAPIPACGLCNLYYVDDCGHCPIFAYTGYRTCEGTPIDTDEGITSEVAKAEIEFLKLVKSKTEVKP